MTFGERIRRSRKAGLHPQPERSHRHHPDFDRLSTEGWKSLEAEGKLSEKGWRKEQQWALDMGLEVSPPYDTSDITALVGVRVVVEALGSMLAHGKLGSHKHIIDKPVSY